MVMRGRAKSAGQEKAYLVRMCLFVCLLHVCMNVSCFVCIMLCSIQMPLKAWFINRADESRHL